MASKSTFIRHVFGGGLATDFGPTTDVSPQEDGTLVLPWLNVADNIIFEADGGPHKVPGTSKINSVELESGAVVKGVFDAWFSGTAGQSSQHRIIHVGAKIKKDDADGSFSDLFTGLETDKVPSYSMLEDILVMASDSTTDVPKSWDGSTAQSLAGSPPNFAICATHKNRMWAAGDATNPSRLYFSVLLDPGDWVSSGSGNIDIDPDDGDVITGIRSHRNELWVFKGPYKGSIHRITGSSPTGADAFARTTFVTGLGASGHNTTFSFRGDLGFMWSDGNVYSLEATSAFGDFREAALSRPINTWIRDHINHARLKHAWAADWPEMGIVLFAIPIDTSQDNNIILMMDYRFSPVRWAKWPSFDDVAGSIGLFVDAASNNRRIVIAGGNDGFVRKLGQPNRSIDGDSSIAMQAQTPFLTYGSPILKKTFAGGGLGIAPKNDRNITFSWVRDGGAAQTSSIAQGGGGVLGPADEDEFTLGTSALAGSEFVQRFFDAPEGGEFSAIQYSLENNVNNDDVEIHSFSSIISRGAWSTENA